MNQHCACSEGRTERGQEVLDEVNKEERGNDVQNARCRGCENLVGKCRVLDFKSG